MTEVCKKYCDICEIDTSKKWYEVLIYDHKTGFSMPNGAYCLHFCKKCMKRIVKDIPKSKWGGK